MVDFAALTIAYCLLHVEMNHSPVQLPPSQRTSYQFPVYRWMGWLAVAGFVMGLTMMFFISGMFGIPPPLGWAFLVIIFTAGALLLERPKLLLSYMIFYFMLVPGNRLFGLLGLPLPGYIDELFFLPLIAVIVMYWIQRHQLKEATLFPVLFCLVAALSWYVNGKPSPFTAIQVTLIMLKSYILWYFCRLTCTFENRRQLTWWFWAYVIYVAVQFPYNMLWQRGPWPKNVDMSGGVFGPDSYGSHLIGYLSAFALLLLAGWWVSVGSRAQARLRGKALLLALIIGYNFVFMTDTKHALVMLPFVFLPFLFHPRFPVRLRIGLLSAGLLFVLASVFYFNLAVGQKKIIQIWDSIENTPKGEMFYAVTVDFPHLVPYPMLGAGPGRFASNQARDNGTPLARRYILPYFNEARRLGYYGRRGTTVISSVVGSVNTDFFVLMGEFGWIGALLFYGFYIWVVGRLIRKSMVASPTNIESGFFMALACCLIFLIMATALSSVSTVPPLVFPLWILIGRAWDMRTGDEEPAGLPARGS
jgi:hypothetical protein